ncbi:MAG: ATP-binding cassette domain-containing protein, partial [Gammaproteobacteria bacterium]|nr:ATP-binding cassette domain-containing protein [Gammaproteobacteria bacterium]
YSGKRDALSEITLHIDTGEMVFLTGHSGAGKSTLLKLIAAIEKPSTGEVIVNGQNIHRLKQHAVPRLRRQIGLIFQTPYLLRKQTVFENVALPLVIEGLRHKEITSRTHAVLGQVGLLDLAKAFPDALSCGEQQRVGIARAIVTKPFLLLADEPTGNLDPGLAEQMIRLFECFNQMGMTTLIASHNLALLRQFKRRTLTLDAGRLCGDEKQ